MSAVRDSIEHGVQGTVVDDRIRSLVIRLEGEKDPVRIPALVRKLIGCLRENLERPEVKARYQAYRDVPPSWYGPYPVDGGGYAVAFDPLTEEGSFWDAWARYGIVVGKGVVVKSVAENAIVRMQEIVLALSEGRCDLGKPATWGMLPEDVNGTALVLRGFFEVYHDAALAELRQSVRMYIHHVLIWGSTDLWTSFDRLGAKLPGRKDSRALPLHVDQNPKFHPSFKTVQGVLALADCPLERGTFAGIPGSAGSFSSHFAVAPDRGEYVELPETDPLTMRLAERLQPFPLRAGDLVSWDSRTVHANTENVSDQVRYVAYIAAGPAREEDRELVRIREEAFQTGVGSNVREALMHASKKSRYSNPDAIGAVRKPESLSPLGELLYGKASYANL
jgi:hypothetical protein